MCSLYSHNISLAAIKDSFPGIGIAPEFGNMEPGRVYPDQMAPIIRRANADGVELALARWGMPTPPQYLKTTRDPGVINVRNSGSAHWRRWTGPANRCLVPLDQFAEPAGKGKGSVWFHPAQSSAQIFFAGFETRDWTSVRKVKDGETTDDLFAFLTTEPNSEVAKVHPKAMPVILTCGEEFDLWLNGEWEIARSLQRPLPDGWLRAANPPG